MRRLYPAVADTPSTNCALEQWRAQYVGAVEGTSVSGSGSAITVVILEFSSELREALRQYFAAFCYGAMRASEDDDYYSFARTVEAFFANFDAKGDTTKLGMIGELLMHLLHPSTHSDLLGAAIYFNKEERNVKKGFDLSFLDADADAIWYGEVKSGRVRENSNAEQKAHDLLTLAARDLHDKLTAPQRSRWDSAIHDADLTLSAPEAATVKQLLRIDATQLESGSPITRRAFLGALTVHDHEHCRVSDESTRRTAEAIASSGKFDHLRVLAIQHTDESDIIDFLREGLLVS